VHYPALSLLRLLLEVPNQLFFLADLGKLVLCAHHQFILLVDTVGHLSNGVFAVQLEASDLAVVVEAHHVRFPLGVA
jgi:hypothetical protein